MIIEKICTGRDKSLYKCDRCGCRLKEGENVRYKITIVKMPVKKGGDNRRNYDLCDRCCYIIDKLIRKGVEKWDFYMMLKTELYLIVENGTVKLSIRESRLLEVLSNGKINSYEDVIKYIYKDNKKHTRNAISLIKNRLIKKINLNIIETVYDRGLTLKDGVFIFIM